jgi:predicted nuclease with TOPRIM domain
MARENGTDDDKLESLKNQLQNLALAINSESIHAENLKDTVEKLEGKFDDLSKKVESNKDEIIKAVTDEFVRLIEFRPIKGFVYGLITLICAVVLMGLMTLVVSPSIQHKEQNSSMNSLLPPQ